MATSACRQVAVVAVGLLVAVLLATTLTEALVFEALKSAYGRTRSFGHSSMEMLPDMSELRSLPTAAVHRAMSIPSAAARRVFARSSDGDGDGDNDTSKAMCVFSRGPNLNSPPTLYYFSPEVDPKGSCKALIEIKLVGRNGYRQLDESYARKSIKTKLLNEGVYYGDRPTYFLIHGFLADWHGSWLCNTKNLILSRADANVFLVDWSGGSKPMLPLDYGASVSNTPYVGALIARFIEILIEMSGQRNANQFHLIGHSLGAHISGFVGYQLKTLGQITGLDPAGPCFSANTEQESQEAEVDGMMHKGKRRLSQQSANYVMALHTDTPLFGLNENCAHFDVYVNGGQRQPRCPSLDPKSKLEDLLRLDLASFLSLDITCCHSYAHKILDSFIDFAIEWRRRTEEVNGVEQDVRSGTLVENNLISVSSRSDRGSQSIQEVDDGDEENRCYPIAYQCADWVAFLSGECGFCTDQDTHCIFTGISLHLDQIKKSQQDELEFEKSALLESQLTTKSNSYDREDINFNNESDDDDEEDQEETNLTVNAKPPALLGQHFIKAGVGLPMCLLHYQIVVATRKDRDADKEYYYLQIPLEKEGKFRDAYGNRLQDRLVQISHKIEQKSAVYQRLRTVYMEALAERAGDNIDESRRLGEGIEFYTALITFQQATECGANGETNGVALNKNSWKLCKPLAELRDVRLWSPSAEKLEALEWVAINYMSGINYEQRMGNSFLLQRDLREPIRQRKEVEHSEQASLGGMRPKSSNGLRRSAARAARTADRLLFGMLQCSGDMGDAEKRRRCGRNSKELRYAVNLTPSRL